LLVDVQVREDGPWTVVAVVGELDLAAAPRIRHAAVAALASSPGPPQVILDLEAVPLIDSSGLGVVLGVLRRVRQAGGTLRVVAGPPATDLLALLGIDVALDVHPSVAAAQALEPATPSGSGDPGHHG
jgi:anti-anti-sigma factor